MNHADARPAVLKATVARLEGGAAGALASVKMGVVAQSTALPYIHIEFGIGDFGRRTTSNRSQVITPEITVYSDEDSPDEAIQIMGAIRTDLATLLDLSSYGSFSHTGYDEPSEDGPRIEEDEVRGRRMVGRFLQPQWVVATQ